jgi:hypothetical protein
MSSRRLTAFGLAAQRLGGGRGLPHDLEDVAADDVDRGKHVLLREVDLHVAAADAGALLVVGHVPGADEELLQPEQ